MIQGLGQRGQVVHGLEGVARDEVVHGPGGSQSRRSGWGVKWFMDQGLHGLWCQVRGIRRSISGASWTMRTGAWLVLPRNAVAF